jgi:hypothetical protein
MCVEIWGKNEDKDEMHVNTSEKDETTMAF